MKEEVIFEFEFAGFKEDVYRNLTVIAYNGTSFGLEYRKYYHMEVYLDPIGTNDNTDSSGELWEGDICLTKDMSDMLDMYQDLVNIIVYYKAAKEGSVMDVVHGGLYRDKVYIKVSESSFNKTYETDNTDP